MSVRTFLQNRRPPDRANPETRPPSAWTLSSGPRDAFDEGRVWTEQERFAAVDEDKALALVDADYLAQPGWLVRPGDLARLRDPWGRVVRVYVFEEHEGGMTAREVPSMETLLRYDSDDFGFAAFEWASALGRDWTRTMAPFNGVVTPSSWLMVAMNLGLTREALRAVHDSLALLSEAMPPPRRAWGEAMAALDDLSRPRTPGDAPAAWPAMNAAWDAYSALRAEQEYQNDADYTRTAYGALRSAMENVMSGGSYAGVLEGAAESLTRIKYPPEVRRRRSLMTAQAVALAREELLAVAHRALPLSLLAERAAAAAAAGLRYDWDAAWCSFDLHFEEDAWSEDRESEDPARRARAEALVTEARETQQYVLGDVGDNQMLAVMLSERATDEFLARTSVAFGSATSDDDGVTYVAVRVRSEQEVARVVALFDSDGRGPAFSVPYVRADNLSFSPEGVDGKAWRSTLSRKTVAARTLADWSAWYARRSELPSGQPRAARPPRR